MSISEIFQKCNGAVQKSVFDCLSIFDVHSSFSMQ